MAEKQDLQRSMTRLDDLIRKLPEYDGAAGLKGLWEVLEHYGCWNEEGLEAQAKSWCDKIILSIDNKLAMSTTKTEPSRPSSSSLPNNPKKRRIASPNPSQKGRISSPAALTRSQAAAHHIRNLPTVSSASTSRLSSRKPLSETRTSPNRSKSTSVKGSMGSISRLQSIKSESTLSDLEMPSSNTSVDERDVKPTLPSSDVMEVASEVKRKAREESEEPIRIARQRSACPSPNLERKPKAELPPATMQLAHPGIDDYTSLSTHDRMRIALLLAPDLVLPYFENPWPDLDLSFTRDQIGGSTTPALTRNAVIGVDALCLKVDYNIAPGRFGECGIFFYKGSEYERVSAFKNFPVFVAGDQSMDWRYRGQYDIVNGGFTATRSLTGMNVSRKAEDREVLEAYYGDWLEDIREDFGFSSTSQTRWSTEIMTRV